MSGRYRLAAILIDSSCGRGALPISQALRAGRAGGNTLERYGYDAGGARVRKVSGGTTTYTFFAHCEEEATNGATTVISHYSFAGLRIAVKRGSTLYHVHGDHLGSTSLTTSAAGVEGGRDYHPYGFKRAVWGTLHTDRTFTGQKEDGTGLLYYNARNCDPALGTFISPDTVVPDAGMVVDYNRFLYARGNPLKYSDPSGHEPYDYDPDWHDKDRWYRAHGFRHDPDTHHWTIKVPAEFRDKGILLDVLNEAGIQVDGADNWWGSGELTLLAQGVVALAQKIAVTKFGAYVSQAGIEAGFPRSKSLIGGFVTWYRASAGTEFCAAGDACATEPGRIGIYEGLFRQKTFSKSEHHNFIRGIAVHELAHKIHIQKVCPNNPSAFCLSYNIGEPLYWDVNPITGYGDYYWERWAEAVTDWVYGLAYQQRGRFNTPRNPVNADQIQAIEEILWP